MHRWAAFLGFLATILGIFYSFEANNGEKSALLAELNARLSDAFVPTALGLFVAIPAFCFYRYLCQRVETFDTEMENVGLELVNCLALHLARVRSSA